MKKTDQDSLISALKDNVQGKQELIEKLLTENREFRDRLTNLTIDYYHVRGADAENNRAYAQAKQLLEDVIKRRSRGKP